MRSQQPFLEPGTAFADYEVQSVIGRGGMGVVYQARDVRLDRKVALKLLAPEFTAHENFRARFLRESRLAAAVDHPNIIPIYEAGDAFYWSPGHSPEALEDCEYVDVSPTEGLERVIRHLQGASA